MSRPQNAIGLVILFFVAIAAWPVSAVDEKKEPRNKPATEKAADPFAVPEGTTKELAQYLQKLTASLPRDAETRKKAQESVLKAADKILAGKPNEDELEVAVQAKISVLQNDPEQLARLAAELKKGGHEQWARRVRVVSLQMGLYKAALTAKHERIEKSIADVVKFLEETPPQPTDVNLAFMAGRLAEKLGDNNLTINTYRSLAKAFGTSKDKNLVDFAKTLEGVVRRLNLVGNEIRIEGKLLDKKEFDWSKYAGKVVLVDFWATWCGPCVAEIPNMKKCYDLYHAKGFDIVGLSCDRNVADLEKFVKEKNIPWAIVFGDGKPSPTVSYYGIMAIPTMVLVGKDGRVVSLNARGEKLKEELAKLLGPVEEKKDVKGSEEKKQEPNKMADGNKKK